MASCRVLDTCSTNPRLHSAYVQDTSSHTHVVYHEHSICLCATNCLSWPLCPPMHPTPKLSHDYWLTLL